jgi:preprotein translocase subunit YajC
VAIVLLIVMGPMLAGMWFILRRKRLAREARRSPLTTKLLRTPGHSLQQRLDDLRLDFGYDVATLVLVPGITLSFLHITALVKGRMESIGTLVILLVVVIGVAAYQVRSLSKRQQQMDQLRLGLDAELAAGQELDQLMRRGAAVFHDVPGEDDKFNVDHVVVAPQGVFAVETKGYRKPIRGAGLEDAKVVYDGQRLRFPDWESSKPLAQAQRQAAWLSQWLSKAMAEPIAVTPVLALPGWYIDLKGRGEVLVLNSAQLQLHLLQARGAKPLDATRVERAAALLEERCRNVKPAYRPDDDE